MGSVTYSPLDSIIVERIQRAFPSDELRESARTTHRRALELAHVAEERGIANGCKPSGVPDAPTHIGVRESQQVLTEATTLDEASRIFRFNRQSARLHFCLLGVRDHADSRSKATFLDDVLEKLCIDPDESSNSSSTGCWWRTSRTRDAVPPGRRSRFSA